MANKTIWQDKFIIEVYNLSRSGLTELRMAKELGISLPTFRVWERKKKCFKLALQMGRKERRRNDDVDWKNYIYKRLPSELRRLWRKINKLDKAKNGSERIEAILAQEGKIVRQHLFIHAWLVSLFSISRALRKVNISMETFNRWKKDPIFLRMIKEIDWHKKNFLEDCLYKSIKKGDTSAIIFANRTYNKDRGYNDKLEIGMNLSGQIEQNIMSIDILNLPLDIRKEILKSLRQKKK